jgi:hypothetical protein
MQTHAPGNHRFAAVQGKCRHSGENRNINLTVTLGSRATMKEFCAVVIVFLVPITAFAEQGDSPTLSSACQIRSLPGGKDGSTVEYSWKITAKTTEDRVLSVEQLTRSERPSPLPDLRGSQKFLYCKAGSPHEKEIRLEVDQAAHGGERAYWLEGFLTSLINEDVPLPESATVSVTTRQISDDDEPGHLIGITVSSNGRELSRHYIFISFWSPADLQAAPLWSELNENERDLRDGNVWQTFTEAKGWEPRIRRFTELDKQAGLRETQSRF